MKTKLFAVGLLASVLSCAAFADQDQMASNQSSSQDPMVVGNSAQQGMVADQASVAPATGMVDQNSPNSDTTTTPAQ